VEPKTLFQRIADREIPSTIVFEDDRCIAIRDINPVAPTHILVVPRRPIVGVQDVAAGDEELIGHLFVVARQLAEEAGLAGGYRLVLNVGDDAGQTVPHLHVHLIGGRRMAWPPG
jgi:histidine triad (HIT) family protein